MLLVQFRSKQFCSTWLLLPGLPNITVLIILCMCLHRRTQFWYGESKEPLFLIQRCGKTPVLLLNWNTCKRQIIEDSDFFSDQYFEGLFIKSRLLFLFLMIWCLLPSYLWKIEDKFTDHLHTRNACTLLTSLLSCLCEKILL